MTASGPSYPRQKKITFESFSLGKINVGGCSFILLEEKLWRPLRKKGRVITFKKVLSALTSQGLWHLFYPVSCAEYGEKMKRGSLLLSLHLDSTFLSHPRGSSELWLLLGWAVNKSDLCHLPEVRTGSLHAGSVWDLLHSCLRRNRSRLKELCRKAQDGTDKCSLTSRIFVISCILKWIIS